ncbi:MAG: hypothetical protein UX26_C0022G0017 [Parcubacteria group bacterium GW2011_GWC1_45_9]|nr:MAG: hypothetical protein UX26_C0022G0017 [Parcubacteria group bacterium GW2011_GWC1_45_9]HCI05627.1 hypothetical protein [Patescibacteria group bacterium]
MKLLSWLFIFIGFFLPLFIRAFYPPTEIPLGIYVGIWVGGGICGVGSFILLKKGKVKPEE